MKKDIIDITNPALSYIDRMLIEEKKTRPQVKYFRIALEKGGCSGNKYGFSFTNDKSSGDEEINISGLNILIAQSAILNVIGSTLDYEETIFDSKLVFINPNEKSRCGCGKSIQF